MSKIQSGIVLMIVGVVLNILGRLISPSVRASQNVTFAGLLAALMLISVVVVLFGLFRLVRGLISRS